MESPPENLVELPTEFKKERELAPWPGGDMPVDRPDSAKPRWNNRRWVVWRLLHQGYTSRQAAEAAGYKNIESVRMLRKEWKTRYGVNIAANSWDEVLHDPLYAKPVTADDIEEKVSHDHLVIGVNARALTQAWLNEFLGDGNEAKARRARLTATEVSKIQEIGLSAERASQGLLEAPTKGKAAPPTPAEPKTATGAQKAVGALGKAPRRGPKGKQAEDAGSIVVGLRQALGQFKETQADVG